MASIARTLQARKQDLVRDAIWDAAIDVFAAKGFDQTTIEEIAAAAGVSRRSFFRYFASKDDLMGQGISTYGTALTDAIVSAPRIVSHLEVVRRTVALISAEAVTHPRTRKVIQIARDNPSARQAQLSRMADVQERVTDAFAHRCPHGDSITPRLLMHFLLGALDVTFHSWYDRGGDDISLIATEVLDRLSDLSRVDSRTPQRKRHPRPASTRP